MHLPGPFMPELKFFLHKKGCEQILICVKLPLGTSPVGFSLLRLGSPPRPPDRLRGNSRPRQALLRVRPTVANASWTPRGVAARGSPRERRRLPLSTGLWRSAARAGCVAQLARVRRRLQKPVGEPRFSR